MAITGAGKRANAEGMKVSKDHSHSVDDKKFFRARHAGSSLWSYWVFYDEVNAKQTQMGWE